MIQYSVSFKSAGCGIQVGKEPSQPLPAASVGNPPAPRLVLSATSGRVTRADSEKGKGRLAGQYPGNSHQHCQSRRGERLFSDELSSYCGR